VVQGKEVIVRRSLSVPALHSNSTHVPTKRMLYTLLGIYNTSIGFRCQVFSPVIRGMQFYVSHGHGTAYALGGVLLPFSSSKRVFNNVNPISDFSLIIFLVQSSPLFNTKPFNACQQAPEPKYFQPKPPVISLSYTLRDAGKIADSATA